MTEYEWKGVLTTARGVRCAAKHFDSKISNACNATRAISADLTGDAWIAADSKDVSLTAALTNAVAAKNVLF